MKGLKQVLDNHNQIFETLNEIARNQAQAIKDLQRRVAALEAAQPRKPKVQ